MIEPQDTGFLIDQKEKTIRFQKSSTEIFEIKSNKQEAITKKFKKMPEHKDKPPHEIDQAVRESGELELTSNERFLPPLKLVMCYACPIIDDQKIQFPIVAYWWKDEKNPMNLDKILHCFGGSATEGDILFIDEGELQGIATRMRWETRRTKEGYTEIDMKPYKRGGRSFFVSGGFNTEENKIATVNFIFHSNSQYPKDKKITPEMKTAMLKFFDEYLMSRDRWFEARLKHYNDSTGSNETSMVKFMNLKFVGNNEFGYDPDEKEVEKITKMGEPEAETYIKSKLIDVRLQAPVTIIKDITGTRKGEMYRLMTSSNITLDKLVELADNKGLRMKQFFRSVDFSN